MFRVFRQLRKSIIANGRISEYLKYSFGEIILVVVGILIALQINNVNQSIKDGKALNEFLVKVQSHTQQDIIQLDTMAFYRQQMSNVCKAARASMLNKTEDDNLILLMSSGVAFADFTFKPNTGGYEALKNSIYFGKINNTKLDSLLTRYHRLLDELYENESSYNEFMVTQEANLSTQFDQTLILASAFLPPDSLNIKATTQEEYFRDFKAYTSLPSYRNVISLAAFQFDTMVDQAKRLKELGNEIIEEIDLLITE